MKKPTDEKTRLRGQAKIQDDANDASKNQLDHDKTLIKATNLESDNNKTRILKPNDKNKNEDVNNDLSNAQSIDKTRFSPAKNHQNIDATRLKPSVKQSNAASVAAEDATRISPAKTVADEQGSATASASVNQRPVASDHASKYGVLKGRFALEEVLGTGGMGIVYKAKDMLKVEANDREPYVAIKVLSDEFKAHPEAFISLQRESRKSQRIAHPNIVNVHDFDRDDDTVFMTMEYMEGKSLDKLIRQYKSTGLPTDDALNIIKGMSRALIYAHAEHIVHSDFKPGNVFVTDKGVTKVFDFGIARAVAKAESFEDNPEDKTLFDAGNLGALTPPYASLEMLEGEEPDIRDDIYALGCVAYELFTGEHPFNKLPADEACKQKLKPKRIAHLRKRQWRAIEKALAFKREDRIASVLEFLNECEAVYKLPILIPVVALVILALSGVIYFQYISVPEGPSEAGIRTELEYKIRMELHKDTMAQLLETPLFTVSWEEQVWSEIQAVRIIIKKQDQWLPATENTVYQLYLQQISQALTAGRLKRTGVLIDNASRYTNDTSTLDEQRALLANAIAKRVPKDQIVSIPAPRPRASAPAKKKTSTQLFDSALANVNQQLQCGSKISMRDLDTAITKLKSLDAARYKRLEPTLVKSLTACITKIGKTFPERAEEAKKYALRIFKSSRMIANIKIKPRDPCDASIAGLGARGQRAMCKDKIQGNNSGPPLVVVPKSRGIKGFAISKYEVSIGELNLFCKKSSQCKENATKSASLPASNISIKVAEAYMQWLSKKSGKKYRLPTIKEWIYAAKSKSVFLDPNRNCKLSTRGIQKGAGLLKISTGKQSSWGLVNYVGNVQEWVYGSGKAIIAAGGSYDTPMENCDINTKASHSGQADPNTGFRVLREIN